MWLNACYSAEHRGPKKYELNSWQTNVAKRGRFVGYTGGVDLVNKSCLYRSFSGENDKTPYEPGLKN